MHAFIKKNRESFCKFTTKKTANIPKRKEFHVKALKDFILLEDFFDVLELHEYDNLQAKDKDTFVKLME